MRCSLGEEVVPLFAAFALLVSLVGEGRGLGALSLSPSGSPDAEQECTLIIRGNMVLFYFMHLV